MVIRANDDEVIEIPVGDSLELEPSHTDGYVMCWWGKTHNCLGELLFSHGTQGSGTLGMLWARGTVHVDTHPAEPKSQLQADREVGETEPRTEV